MLIAAIAVSTAANASCAFAAPGASAAEIRSMPATEFSAQRRIRHVATRIEVYPNTRRVRRCVDWYAVEPRPSGDVITPHVRCWWAAR
jgi:hypothetical protein